MYILFLFCIKKMKPNYYYYFLFFMFILQCDILLDN